jgi:sec-independent protein translocase protein TatA
MVGSLGVSVGAPELILVFLVVLLLFGATQLPKLARSMGQASKEFRQGLAEGAPDDDDENAGDEKKAKS